MNKYFFVLVIFGFSALPATARANAQPCTFLVKKINAPKQIVAREADLRLEVELETNDCAIPVPLNSPHHAEPAVIWMKPKAGLQVHGSIGYHLFVPRDNLLPEAQAHVLNAQLTAKTMPDLTPGDQLIEFEMTYKAIDTSDVPVEGRFAFNVPIHVVAPKPPTFWDKHEKTKTVLVNTGVVLILIPLTPILFVLGLFGIWDGC